MTRGTAGTRESLLGSDSRLSFWPAEGPGAPSPTVHSPQPPSAREHLLLLWPGWSSSGEVRAVTRAAEAGGQGLPQAGVGYTEHDLDGSSRCWGGAGKTCSRLGVPTSCHTGEAQLRGAGCASTVGAVLVQRGAGVGRSARKATGLQAGAAGGREGSRWVTQSGGMALSSN